MSANPTCLRPSSVMLTHQAGQEEQEGRDQAHQAQGKIFTPGDFGKPLVEENPTQVSASIECH